MIANARIVVRRCPALPRRIVSTGSSVESERVSDPIRPATEPEPDPAAASSSAGQLDAETAPRSADVEAGCAAEPGHDAEPGPEPRAHPDAIGALHRCQHCDQPIANPHWRRRFCSGRCRVQSHRAARRKRGR